VYYVHTFWLILLNLAIIDVVIFTRFHAGIFLLIVNNDLSVQIDFVILLLCLDMYNIILEFYVNNK
jgi:hypothetical protein